MILDIAFRIFGRYQKLWENFTPVSLLNSFESERKREMNWLTCLGHEETEVQRKEAICTGLHSGTLQDQQAISGSPTLNSTLKPRRHQPHDFPHTSSG